MLGAFQGGEQDVQTKTVSIQPYKSLQNYEHFRRMVLECDDDWVEYIDGFDYEWGYTYALEIEETRLASDLSDGTRYEHKLLREISKTPAPDSLEFRLYLSGQVYYYDLGDDEDGRSLKAVNDSTYRYFDEVDIEVPLAFREAFSRIVSGEMEKRGVFRFTPERRLRLVGLK